MMTVKWTAVIVLTVASRRIYFYAEKKTNERTNIGRIPSLSRNGKKISRKKFAETEAVAAAFRMLRRLPLPPANWSLRGDWWSTEQINGRSHVARACLQRGAQRMTPTFVFVLSFFSSHHRHVAIHAILFRKVRLWHAWNTRRIQMQTVQRTTTRLDMIIYEIVQRSRSLCFRSDFDEYEKISIPFAISRCFSHSKRARAHTHTSTSDVRHTIAKLIWDNFNVFIFISSGVAMCKYCTCDYFRYLFIVVVCETKREKDPNTQTHTTTKRLTFVIIERNLSCVRTVHGAELKFQMNHERAKRKYSKNALHWHLFSDHCASLLLEWIDLGIVKVIKPQTVFV